jgi:EpsI family protein
MKFIITILLLAGTILAAALSERRNPDVLAIPLDRIDHQISGWNSVRDEQLDATVLRKLDPTSYLSRIYQKENSQLDLFIAFYAQQRAGESMHSPKHCLPGAGWEIWKHGSALAPFNTGQVEINNYSIENAGRRMIMLYWYQSKDRIVASEYTGKLLLARDALFAGHTSGSIVRIMLPDAPGKTEEGLAFASSLIPQVQRCFGK